MRTDLLGTVLAISAGLLCFQGACTAGQIKDKSQETSNGLPNISSRFHPDSTGFTVSADLLVWTAGESGADNWAEVFTSGGSTTSCNIEDVRFDWSPGFRVGLGYGMSHDQWDTQFYYTWFNTQGKKHVSHTPGSVYSAFIGNFYVDNPTGAGIIGIAYQKANIKWTVHFNMFDWELGRAFWVSKALSLRPFVGLKGGWINQSIHTTWHNPNLTIHPGSPPYNTGTENLKNNFWGVGPSGGLNTKWNLLTHQNHSFSLFEDFSGAIMYGNWIFGDVFKNDASQEVDIKSSSLNGAASMFRTFTGFGWDVNFSQDRFYFSTRLGYEIQFWLDQLQFYSFDTGRQSNVLTLQGGTLEFRFDF